MENVDNALVHSSEKSSIEYLKHDLDNTRADDAAFSHLVKSDFYRLTELNLCSYEIKKKTTILTTKSKWLKRLVGIN